MHAELLSPGFLEDTETYHTLAESFFSKLFGVAVPRRAKQCKWRRHAESRYNY